MKTRKRTGIGILLATLTAGAVLAAPPPVVPPQGGTMRSTPVGGTMVPTAVGGSANAMLAPNNTIEPLPSMTGAFSFGPPGGTIYLNPYGYYPNPAIFGAPGAMLNGRGVGGVKSTTSVPGATNAPGANLNPYGVGGTYHGTIVAGPSNTAPGGALTGNGVGGTANGVIVTGGAAPSTSSTTTGSTSGSSVIVTGSAPSSK